MFADCHCLPKLLSGVLGVLVFGCVCVSFVCFGALGLVYLLVVYWLFMLL